MKKYLALLIAVIFGTVLAGAQTLTSITIIPPSTGFYAPTVGSTVQPTAVCAFSNGTTNNCSSTSLTWGSTDTNILTVNSSTGLVTNVSTNVDASFAEVYAYNGHITGHHAVAFAPLSADPIVWQPSGYTTVVVGSTVILSPAIDTIAEAFYCNFTTDTPSVATVNVFGEVTGVGAGTANITCTIGTRVSSIGITVTSPTQSIHTWYGGRSGGAPRNNSVTSGAVIFADGTVDADCPTTGSGTFHCAFSNPMWLFTDNSGGGSYTGVVQSGDTAIIDNIATQAAGTPSAWPMVCFAPTNSTCWNTNAGFGAIILPAGTPAHHTKILGANWASCSKNSDVSSNRAMLWGQFTTRFFTLDGLQNIDFGCLDIGTYEDCQNPQIGSGFAFGCEAPPIAPFTVNGLSASLTFTDVVVHGWQTSITGTPGPGLVFTDFRAIDNWADGVNFAEPFGPTGQQADGFEGHYFDAIASGFSEEQPKVISSLIRNSSGVLTVTFPPTAAVNYVAGTNITLIGNTPSDLNGTFPVSAITFNQQTVSITGGSCIFDGSGGNNGLTYCTYNTSTAPAFGQGAFVNITGTSISGGVGTNVNGTYEVFAVTGSSFQVNANPVSRPTWGTGTIASGGTASTANTLTATASGGTETATTTGVAGHVTNHHHGFDQGTCATCNGDGFGAGDGTRGVDICDHCSFIDNLQDGDDNLHGGLISSSFTNSFASGNEGAGVKVGNADTLIYANIVAIGNCGVQLAFNPDNPPDYNQYIGLPCRANAVIGTGTRAWTVASITNVSAMTGFNVFISNNCSDEMDGTGCQALPTVAVYQAQNNNFVGFIDQAQPDQGVLPQVYFNGSNVSPIWNWVNNNAYRTNGVPWTDPSNLTVNPLIAQPIADIALPVGVGEEAALNFNMNLTSGSPMIGAGVTNTYTPSTDYSGNAQTSPATIGAYVFQGSTPTLVSIAVTPNPASVVAGSTVALTCTSTFSDSSTSACASPTWSTGNSATATVNSSGVVTGVAAGSTTITAAIGMISGGATVNVSALPTVADPVYTPPGGTYSSAQTITLTSTTAGATICFSVGGGTPAATTPGTCTSGTTYTAPFPITSSFMVKALATKAGDTNSNLVTQSYVITAPPGSSCIVVGNIVSSGTLMLCK